MIFIVIIAVLNVILLFILIKQVYKNYIDDQLYKSEVDDKFESLSKRNWGQLMHWLTESPSDTSNLGVQQREELAKQWLLNKKSTRKDIE